MKKINIENTVTIIARKSNGIYKLDYYLREKRGEELYLFTRKYSEDCYRICKSGASVNKVISIKSRNVAVMGLVKYLKIVMPYFITYYDKKTVSNEKNKGHSRNHER